MLPTFVRSFCTLIVVALLPSDVAVATPNDSLAARAVIEAESMPAGRERDVVLREISRNLRHADRDQAIAAATAMSEDRSEEHPSELQSLMRNSYAVVRL